jgi:CheY-like chemotaxis protein
VEDEEQVRSLTTTMLVRKGYHVLEAANAAEALQLASKFGEPIHLLLTDVIMPGMPGPELAREIVASRPATRVLYMSGYTDNAIVHQCKLRSNTPFLRKPFTAAMLYREVREVLD